jgi:dihydropyrimidinase
LETGVFDLFSSDHCPFRYDDSAGKLNPNGRTSFRHIPNGIPGVELRLPILFSEGVVKGRIDLQRFVALSSTNHAKIYGLTSKGSIAIGMDADIALWDPGFKRTVRHADLHDGADYSPYEGLEITGWPTTVILGGKVMVDGEQLRGPKGSGVHRARAPVGWRPHSPAVVSRSVQSELTKSHAASRTITLAQ